MTNKEIDTEIEALTQRLADLKAMKKNLEVEEEEEVKVVVRQRCAPLADLVPGHRMYIGAIRIQKIFRGWSVRNKEQDEVRYYMIRCTVGNKKDGFRTVEESQYDDLDEAREAFKVECNDLKDAFAQVFLEDTTVEGCKEILEMEDIASYENKTDIQRLALNSLTVPVLKKMCKDAGKKGYSKLKKSSLIILLVDGEEWIPQSD